MKEVMSEPDCKQQYYFLIVVKHNVPEATNYTGIILNDEKREVIEFSFEINDPEYERPAETTGPSIRPLF